MSSQNLALICWALARLDVLPAAPWLTAVCARLKDLAEVMNTADVDMLAWAFENKFGPEWLGLR
jgi:hypothetical protein